MTSGEGITVEYALKEVLERIERSISGVDAKLDTKADHADLVELAARKADKAELENLKSELESIKEDQRSVQRRLVTFAFSVALSAVGIALTIIVTSGGHP